MQGNLHPGPGEAKLRGAPQVSCAGSLSRRDAKKAASTPRSVTCKTTDSIFGPALLVACKLFDEENEVKNESNHKVQVRAKVRRIFLAIAAALGILAMAGMAFAQEKQDKQEKKDEIGASAIQPPPAPTLITPEAGNTAFLLGHGKGTQGYVCLPTASGGVSWTVNNARPEATLFANIFGEAVQIITHFLSPVVNPNDIGPKPPRFGDVTWQSSFDSSRVWAQKQHSIPAGSDLSSCPNTGAIDCLLLQVIGADEGPTGGKSLTKTTFIQRLNTKGGSAPTDSCLGPSEIGKQVLVPYSADYYFFRSEQ
jgi:hypothetical protein